MKTWNEIKNETLNLGFEKIKAYNKNKKAYIEAYNWAQEFIASTIGGVLGKIELDINGADRVVFDLKARAEAAGMEYVAISEAGILDENNRRIDGWTLWDNTLLMMPEDFEGKAVVRIMVMPQRLTESAAETTPCQIPDKWAILMPYYMANRLYLDDDAGKAGYYWNLAEDMKMQLLAKEKAVAISVVGGVDIDGWC